MNKLGDIKIFSKKDTEAVYQLNRKLLLKVVQCKGYCEVYYFVLKKALIYANFWELRIYSQDG